MQEIGRAWLWLCAALALHVTDEALTDFLSVYNPTVLQIKQRLPWLPLPVFTFEVWLTGLIAAIVLLSAMSVFIFKSKQWMRPVAYVFAVLMLANAVGHALGTINMGRPMPGVFSSPFLAAASVWLLYRLISAPMPRVRDPGFRPAASGRARGA